MEKLQKLYPELKMLIVEVLNLEDITPEEIKDDEALFVEGLGLDSIDALELTVALEKKYNIKFEDEKKARKAFQSVKSLANFIACENHG